MLRKAIPQEIKNIYHLLRAVAANFWSGFPGKKIKVIGVTGTNGKTTTVQMISKILESAGKKVAMASTINFKIGEEEWVNDTKFTTLDSWSVQKFIREAVEKKCEYLVLETASHALDQYRVWGVKYDTAVITNITREHLDYHKTMEKYRKAKKVLFKNVRVAVVNLDMEKPEDFLDSGAKITYGYSTRVNERGLMNNKQDIKVIKAEDIQLALDGTNYKLPASTCGDRLLTRGGQTTIYKLSLPGLFNVENALAATCVGLAYGIAPETIKEALESLKVVPGRLEGVPNNLGIKIIVDYAVTPDSLEKLYDYISQMKKEDGRIISIFGSCGERDRGKRPIMGKIVSGYVDYVILTNEDPHHEDPWQIIDEVAGGIENKKEGENFWKILDRREAIQKSLELARPGDIIVITGKGAEENMAIGDKLAPWNDKKVILEEIKNLSLRSDRS